MEAASRAAGIISSWRNADRHLIHPHNPHVDDVVWRLNLLMRGYELGRIRFNSLRPSVVPETAHVTLQWREVRLIHHLGTYSLVIPVKPDVALPLEGFDPTDEEPWGTVEFVGAAFVKITRPISLGSGIYAYEHDVFWRHRPRPA
jgi:hypothetical protein